MAFSLSNWFKGKPGSEDAAPEQEKPAGKVTATVPPRVTASPVVTKNIPAVRKVVPNSVQPVSLRDPSARPPVQLPVGTPPPASSSRPAPSLGQQPPRKISFGNPSAASAFAPAPEPVAPAPMPSPAPMPVPDVMVSLEVGDFLDRLPPTLLADGNFDRHRRVEFHSSELYSDLAKGRASVPASVIYQKVPELFSRPVSETEDAEVSLPLSKLVEQLSQAFTTRADQVAEENVGEIETPFLQVAMEDNARLPKAAGSAAGPVRPLMPAPVAAPTSVELPARPPHRTGQIQTISPLKTPVEPPPMQAAPTAQTAGPINPSKRPPSTVRASVAGGKIRLSGPSVPNRITAVPAAVPPTISGMDDSLPPSATQRLATPSPASASPSLQVSKKTARIQIPPISLRSPNGPAAAPRPPAAPPPVPVQASPVTVRRSPGGEPASPPPISFRSSPPPPPSVKPMPHSFAPPPRPTFPPPAFPVNPPPMPIPAMAAPLPPVPAPVADDRKMTLGLAAVLRGLSSSLLSVEPSSVPDDVRISLPFSLIEPQLSSGRVSVPRDTFLQALPENHREVLDPGADLPEIPLPLQEVFQNLPSNALSIRHDQVEEVVGNLYPTPFSQKAEEDAQRLGVGEVPPAPLAPPTPEAVAAPTLPTDHPLPVDEPAAELVAEAAAPAVVAHAPEIAAPSVVEESPAAPHRDIPLDLEDKTPAAEEKAPVAETAEPVVEARAETLAPESKPEAPVEDRTPAEVTPEAQAAAEPAPAAPLDLSFVPPAATETPAAFPPVEHTPGIATPATAAEPARAHAPSETGGKWKDTELQVLFMTEDELDAKAVVKLVSGMPGLSGCAVMFGDGLRLAGNFPEEGQDEGFSAMAPPFFKRAKNFATEAQLGNMQAFTVYTDDALYSFFMHDDICLSVRHAGRGFLPGVREKLNVVVRELARMYASAKPAESVDPVI